MKRSIKCLTKSLKALSRGDMVLVPSGGTELKLPRVNRIRMTSIFQLQLKEIQRLSKLEREDGEVEAQGHEGWRIESATRAPSIVFWYNS